MLGMGGCRLRFNYDIQNGCHNVNPGLFLRTILIRAVALLVGTWLILEKFLGMVSMFLGMNPKFALTAMQAAIP